MKDRGVDEKAAETIKKKLDAERAEDQGACEEFREAGLTPKPMPKAPIVHRLCQLIIRRRFSRYLGLVL